MPRVRRVGLILETQLQYFPGTISKLGGILQAFADLTMLIDADGTILETRFDNPQLENRLSKFLPVHRIQDIIPPETAILIEQQMARARELGEIQAFEFSIRAGDELWFDARIGVCSNSQFVLVAREITNHKRIETKLHQQVQRLSALRSIAIAIASGLDLKLLLSLLLEQVTSLLHVDAASILLLNPETNLLTFSSGTGFQTNLVQHTRLKLGEGFAGKVAMDRKIINIPDINLNTMGYPRSPHFSSERFVAYYGLPLVAKGKTLGVLEIFNRTPLALDADWVEFMGLISGQAAIAIDSALMFRDLQRSNVELGLAYDATIEGWSRTLDLRDKEIEGHTRRVADMTVRLALIMGVEKESIVHIRRGATLHDIGKVAIPDEILLKPGPLTEEEWDVMKQHPLIAINLLAPISYLTPALDIPRWHHERWNGHGYPDRLSGEQIPFPARLFAVVDVYDALTSDRPYRKAWSKEDAIRYVESQSGKHFDPRVVLEFMKLVKTNGHGVAI
ncbi:MAG: HD domain-containing phosphohydrolase [Chloroflexota bacterium]